MSVEQPSLFGDWRRTHHRTSDPDTSAAAASPTARTAAMLATLERTYREHPDGLTAEEAATAAGLDPWATSKRVSDLIRLDVLADSGLRRPGSSGRKQRVLVPVTGNGAAT